MACLGSLVPDYTKHSKLSNPSNRFKSMHLIEYQYLTGVGK